MSLEIEVKYAINKLWEMRDAISTRQRKAILRKAAIPVKQAAQNNIQTSAAPHFRYKTGKASGKLKAPKGQGEIAGVYMPGALAESISILSFRQAQTSVYVGAKWAKKNTKGTFGSGGAVDGYYAHMVEYGTVNYPGQYFMRRAEQSTRGVAQKLIISGATKLINDWAKKNKV